MPSDLPVKKGCTRQLSAVGRNRHSGASMAASKPHPARPPASRKATAGAQRSSASQYSRAASTSDWNVLSSSLPQARDSP